MVSRIFSGLSEAVSARFVATVVVACGAVSGLAKQAQAAFAAPTFYFTSVNTSGTATRFLTYPGFSGATPGTLQAALHNQAFLQISVDTVNGLTVTAPTAASYGSTNIAQPFIYTTTIGGATYVNGYAAGDYIGPGVQGDPTAPGKTLTAITSTTPLESADGTIGMFPVGQARYIGYDLGTLAPDGNDYWGYISITVTKADATGMTASITSSSLQYTPNTPVLAGSAAQLAQVPEPVSLSALGLGAVGLLARRRRKMA